MWRIYSIPNPHGEPSTKYLSDKYAIFVILPIILRPAKKITAKMTKIA
jgi:hypothetical protein